MEIGDSIRKLRMWREMTQKELAQRIGMSANALCAIELNRSFPAKETMHLRSDTDDWIRKWYRRIGFKEISSQVWMEAEL